MESQGRGPFELRPEILPPADPTQGQGYRPYSAPGEPRYGDPAFEVPPVPRPRRRWAWAPATYVLLAINLLVFLPMAIRPDMNDWILNNGANYGVLELGYGQWWRLFTATFIHNGYIHFLSNMWCLWNLGLLGESLLGSWGLIAAYVLTGIGGNLLSTAVHPSVPGVGASGAVFGLAGALIVLLKSPLLPVPPQELNRLRRSVIWFAVLNFVIGGGTYLAHTELQIDNMAHLGGFLSGLALGIPLVPKIGSRPAQFAQKQWLTFTVGAFLLLLLGFGIYRFRQGG